jgi:hypothetical protein
MSSLQSRKDYPKHKLDVYNICIQADILDSIHYQGKRRQILSVGNWKLRLFIHFKPSFLAN